MVMEERKKENGCEEEVGYQMKIKFSMEGYLFNIDVASVQGTAR